MVPTEVIDLALRAVEADQNKDYETAVRLYTQVGGWLKALAYIPLLLLLLFFFGARLRSSLFKAVVL